ncbi:MAG TPA: peptidoglycan DD-metalloendopeptidase family protein [Bacteroidales bacterium]|nr:peptidoglycan DD-metalloendopeptidase family protein [Bacteroidales bacterium]
MKKFLAIVLFISLSFNCLFAQSRAELEDTRKKTIEEIAYVDNLLKSTSKEKSESMKSLSIINKKLSLRESVLTGMREEIDLLNYRIGLNSAAIDMMEYDLAELKNDYRNAVLSSYRSKKGNPELVYILSAKDFNQGYKRLKYLQQITKFRRKEAEIIMELRDQISVSKEKLQADLAKISDLKSKEEYQKDQLQKERNTKQSIVRKLGKQEKKLAKELEEKRKIAKKIETEIIRLIEEERRRATVKEVTAEQKLLGENFFDNKGRLPWPVEQGVVTSHFGIQKHPDFKYLTEDNIGIEITSSGTVSARAVFNGEVAKVFSIPGANMTVIVRHGKYLSVYANLVNVKVKVGESIGVKKTIGDVYKETKDNSNSVLKFMIFENEKKYLDPEAWLSKK